MYDVADLDLQHPEKYPLAVQRKILDALDEVEAEWNLDDFDPYPWQRPHVHPAGWPRERMCDERCAQYPDLPTPPSHHGIMLLGGRGTGKTAFGAQYLYRYVMNAPRATRNGPPQRARIIAPTLGDAVQCVTGEAGLQSIDHRIQLKSGSSGLRAVFPNHAIARLFGAHTPDDVERLRAGGNSSFDWYEEAGAMRYLTEAIQQARLGLRIGVHAHMLISTTPRRKDQIVDWLADREHIAVFRGRTAEATHLDPEVRKALEQAYGGTRLGRQELNGEVLTDVEGALWTLAMLDTPGFRPARKEVPPLDRVVVAVDPAVTSQEGSDFTAMAVLGRSNDLAATYQDSRPKGYLLHTEQDHWTPEQAMRRAVALYHEHKADAVVVEANNGGEYLPAVLHLVDRRVPVKVVRATRDKRARAAPVAALYEQKQMRHVGPQEQYAALESQMTTYTGEKGEKSPDLLDACLVAGTMIATADGPTPIERVRPGALVWTRAGWRPVLRAGLTRCGAEVVTVHTVDGRFTCTPDHRVWTGHHGWQRADHLRDGDTLLWLADGLRFRPTMFTGIRMDGRADVYDLTVDGQHEFVADGHLVHNCVWGVWDLFLDKSTPGPRGPLVIGRHVGR